MAFTPTNKHLLMTREFYKELKLDVERIKTCITTEEAQRSADYLLKKLIAKFESKPGIVPKLLQHEQRLAQSHDLSVLGENGLEVK